MGLEIRKADGNDVEVAKRLALNHPYGEFRGYRYFAHDFALDYLAKQVERELQRPDAVAFVVESDGNSIGYGSAARVDWDSDHFGVEMGSTSFLIGRRVHRPLILEPLLEALESALRERGIQHMAVKVDLEDMVGVQAAQRRGCLLVDSVVTYVNNAERPSVSRPPIDSAFELESYTKDEVDQIPPSDVEHLFAFLRSAYKIDRYHMDPWLPSERSDEVYVEWFKNILNGTWVGALHLVRKDGRVVGFASIGPDEVELEELYGFRMRGKGLAGVIPEGRGAYSALVELVSTRKLGGSQFQEFPTQIQNFPVINIWIRQSLTFIRGRFTLHKWIGR